MLAPILALSILQGAPLTSGPDRPAPSVEAADPSVVVVDCQVTDKALTDCMVLGDVAADRTAAALKMTAGLTIPQQVIEAGVSHVRLRIKLTLQDPPSQSGTNGH